MLKNWFGKRKSILVKTVSINLLLVTIMFLFLILMNAYTKHLLKVEYDKETSRDIANVSRTFNQDIEETINLLYRLSIDGELVTLSGKTMDQLGGETALSFIDVINKLKLITVSNQKILDIQVRFDKLGKTVGTLGTANADDDPSGLTELLNPGDSVNDRHRLYYQNAGAVPGGPISFIYKGAAQSFAVKIRNGYYNDMLQKMVPDQWKMIVLLDSAQRIVAASQTIAEPNSDDLRSGLLSRAAKLSLGGVSYNKTFFTDPVSGFTYVYLNSGTQLNASYTGINVVLIAMLLLLVLIDIMVILFLNRNIYVPVTRILKKFQTGGKISEQNEYSALEQIMSAMDRNINEMEHVIHKQSEYVKESLINKYILGSGADDEDNGRSLIHLPKSYLFISCVLENERGENDLRAIGVFERELNDQFEFTKVFLDYKEQIYFVKIEQDPDRERLTALYRNVAAETAFTMMGVSSVHANTNTIQTAYKESQRALSQCRGLDADLEVRLYEPEDRQRADMYDIPIEKINHLIASTLKGNQDDTRACLLEIYETNEFKPTKQVQALNNYLLFILMTIDRQQQVDLDEAWEGSIEDLLHVYNETFMKEKVISLFGYIAAQNDMPGDQLIDDITRYIDEHIHEEISLQTVSEHFSISKSYLSRYFKNKKGINFITYIQQVKIERAKILLHSHISVSETCRMIGFENPSTFIKLFKKLVGVTPGQYQSNPLHDRDLDRPSGE